MQLGGGTSENEQRKHEHGSHIHFPLPFSIQCRIRPSVFKPTVGTGKSFLSMQSLAAHKGQKLWKSNGSLHTLVCNPPLSPGPQASRARAQLLQALSLDEGGPDPGLSDSSSGGSGGPGPFSASVGHVNHLGGSLDRAARSPKQQVMVTAGEMGPLATLSCLPEPPPPYDFTYNAQMAQDSVTLRQGQPGGLSELKGGLSDDDGPSPFAQVRAATPTLLLQLVLFHLSCHPGPSLMFSPLFICSSHSPPSFMLCWDVQACPLGLCACPGREACISGLVSPEAPMSSPGAGG